MKYTKEIYNEARLKIRYAKGDDYNGVAIECKDLEAILDELERLQQSASVEATCEWQEDFDGIYHTSCGQEYCYEAPLRECPDTIYCQHCGKKIVELPQPPELEE